MAETAFYTMLSMAYVKPKTEDRANQHLPPRRSGAATGVWRIREIPDRSALARLPPVLRVFPRRQWRGHRRQPSDGVDRGRGETDRTLRAARCRQRPGRREGGGVQSGKASGGKLKIRGRYRVACPVLKQPRRSG